MQSTTDLIHSFPSNNHRQLDSGSDKDDGEYEEGEYGSEGYDDGEYDDAEYDDEEDDDEGETDGQWEHDEAEEDADEGDINEEWEDDHKGDFNEEQEGEFDGEEEADEGHDAHDYDCVAYLERVMVEQEGFSPESFLDWVLFVQDKVPSPEEIDEHERAQDEFEDSIKQRFGTVFAGLIRQNGAPRQSGTMAQLFFAPVHSDSHVLTRKKYTPRMVCDKGYDGSSSAHCASDLYPVKVDDLDLLKSKNLPAYPHRNMGLQWRLDLDRKPDQVTPLQDEMFQMGVDRFEKDMIARSKFPSYTTLEGSYLKRTFRSLPLAQNLAWTTITIEGIHVPVAYKSDKGSLLGVFCFVRHGSYPKYALSSTAAEGAAMEFAKNILLFLSGTKNKSHNRYASEGGQGNRAKDQGHRNLCLLRTRELANGDRKVRWEDLPTEMQEYIVERGCLPEDGAGDLRTSEKGRKTPPSWLSNVLALIQRGIQSRRTPAAEEQRAQRNAASWAAQTSDQKARHAATRSKSWKANPINTLKSSGENRPYLAIHAKARAAQLKSDHNQGVNMVRCFLYKRGGSWISTWDNVESPVNHTRPGQIMSKLQYAALSNSVNHSSSDNPLELWHCAKSGLVFLKPTPRDNSVLRWSNIYTIKCIMCSRQMKDTDWVCRPISAFNVAKKNGSLFFDTTRPNLVVPDLARKITKP